MILNYLTFLFLWENVLNRFEGSIFFNAILVTTIILNKNKNMILMIDPKVDKYINNYNDAIFTKVKKILINYMIKEHVEIIVKS
jgi:hypothetical protein